MFTLSKAEAEEKGLKPVRLAYSPDLASWSDLASQSHLGPHRLERECGRTVCTDRRDGKGEETLPYPQFKGWVLSSTHYI
ncbi:MAG: hypothetical protein LBF22_09795 [Deltaproteobacteria bacterium]|nr:hypothetical protein [Deltaproteobacteria bacterium]